MLTKYRRELQWLLSFSLSFLWNQGCFLQQTSPSLAWWTVLTFWTQEKLCPFALSKLLICSWFTMTFRVRCSLEGLGMWNFWDKRWKKNSICYHLCFRRSEDVVVCVCTCCMHTCSLAYENWLSDHLEYGKYFFGGCKASKKIVKLFLTDPANNLPKFHKIE